MTIRPIPDEFLGDSFTLISPKKGGGTLRTEISNVRIDRTNAVADYTSAARDCTEIVIWFDCFGSRPADAAFSAGERAEYRGETFELTEVRTFGIDTVHHIKIKARKTGGEFSG